MAEEALEGVMSDPEDKRFLAMIFVLSLLGAGSAFFYQERERGRIDVASGKWKCDQHEITQEWTCWEVGK